MVFLLLLYSKRERETLFLSLPMPVCIAERQIMVFKYCCIHFWQLYNSSTWKREGCREKVSMRGSEWKSEIVCERDGCDLFRFYLHIHKDTIEKKSTLEFSQSEDASSKKCKGLKSSLHQAPSRLLLQSRPAVFQIRQHCSWLNNIWNHLWPSEVASEKIFLSCWEKDRNTAGLEAQFVVCCHRATPTDIKSTHIYPPWKTTYNLFVLW